MAEWYRRYWQQKKWWIASYKNVIMINNDKERKPVITLHSHRPGSFHLPFFSWCRLLERYQRTCWTVVTVKRGECQRHNDNAPARAQGCGVLGRVGDAIQKCFGCAVTSTWRHNTLGQGNYMKHVGSLGYQLACWRGWVQKWGEMKKMNGTVVRLVNK